MQAIILGAGVAGISTAIALKQKGVDVEIYERFDEASTIGAGIVIWPNAAFILDQLGVLKSIKAVAGRPLFMHRLSNEGEKLGSIDISLINQFMAYPSLSILRRDLQSILTEKLESLGIKVRYGHVLKQISTTAEGSTIAHFENGVKVHADVLIGADGRMASVARQFILGDNKPLFQRFINWIGVFESKEKYFEDNAILDYWGVGKRFGIVPINQNKAYWAGGICAQKIEHKNPALYKEELSTHFSDWPVQVRQLIEDVPSKNINKIYVHDHDPTTVWHKYNLIMIGDAAHAPLPTSGQGACQALEDAWHLTNCLLENTDDLQAAFHKFTKIRYQKTSSIIQAARGLATSLFNNDVSYCQARNENSKQTDFSAVAEGMSSLWAQHLPLKGENSYAQNVDS